MKLANTLNDGEPLQKIYVGVDPDINLIYLTLREFLLEKNRDIEKYPLWADDVVEEKKDTPVDWSYTGKGLFSRIKPSEQRISNKYFLDTDKLNNGILELRYNKNRHLTNVKSQIIGQGLKHVLQNILYNDKLDESQYPVLTPYEQNLISTILNMIDKKHLLGDTNGQFQERFQIILAEWSSGNNSDHLRNELKQYIIHAMKINLISRTLGTQMLIEMMT
jgi:hypothetical protein